MEIQDYNEPQLQIETQEGISVIEVFMTEGINRKKFIGLKPEHIDFKEGQRVLPAVFLNGVNNNDVVYFKAYHDPGTKGWLTGGYECVDLSGAFRAFHLDALMIHPSEMSLKTRVGVNNKKVIGANTPQKDPNAPKGKRGRKPLSDEERAKREEIAKQILISNPERKRGRKPLSDEERAKREEIRLNKMPYKDPNAPKGKRGRKPLSPEERAKRDDEKLTKIKLNPDRKRGRPSKNK